MTTELQDAVEASAKTAYEDIVSGINNAEYGLDKWENAHPSVQLRFREQALEFILPAIPYIRIAILRELGYEDRADEEELNLL